jgi:translation elongation factor EF-G
MVGAVHLRICIDKRIEGKRKIAMEAAKIQRWYRLKARENSRKLMKQQKLMLVAATNVQAFARKLLALSMAKSLRVQRDAMKIVKETNALVITRWFRVLLAKAKLLKLREEYQEKVRCQHCASTQISAFWRGCLGRKYARSELESKKGLWKQMWSDDFQAHFYYNQVSLAFSNCSPFINNLSMPY